MDQSPHEPNVKKSAGQSGPRGTRLASQSGQIVIEYVLLLLVACGIAALIAQLLVSRNPDNPGVLTAAWNDVNVAIGKDLPDDVQ